MGIDSAYLILAAAAANLAGAASDAPRRPAADDLVVAQLIFHEHITVRVQSAPAPAPPPFVELKEKKGPACIPMAGIGGAAVIAENSVDFILRGGGRVRAKFDSRCAELDYYSGFYLTPGADGQVCARRDVVRSRAGGECAIERFRSLVPRHKQ